MKNLYDEEQIKRLLHEIKEADAIYACLNYGESFCPEEIADRSICIDGDIATILQKPLTCFTIGTNL